MDLASLVSTASAVVEGAGVIVIIGGAALVIVLIRTFLSFTLEVELDGRWPWQESKSTAKVP